MEKYQEYEEYEEELSTLADDGRLRLWQASVSRSRSFGLPHTVRLDWLKNEATAGRIIFVKLLKIETFTVKSGILETGKTKV